MDVRFKSQYQLRQVDPEPSQIGVNDNRNGDVLNSKPDEASIRWVQLRKLGSVLYPTTSPFGKPTAMICSSKFVAIGTFSADVLLFDYEQTLVAQLSLHDVTNSGNTSETMLGPVTSLAFSLDETHIIVGYGLGSVALFDLEAPPSVKPKLLTLVRPTPPMEMRAHASRKIQYQETHLSGKPIMQCGFISRHRNTFISIDASGVVVVHKYHRVMLEYVTQSRRLLGSYEKPTPLLSASICLNFIALLTADLLEVVAVDSEGPSFSFTEILCIPRSRDTEEDPQGYGITSFRLLDPRKLDYGPDGDNAGQRKQPELDFIYTWGRQLKLVRFDLSKPVSGIASVVSGYVHHDCIDQIDWITSDLIVILSGTATSRLDLVKLSDATVIDTEVLSPSTRKIIKLVVSGYSIFALGKYEFSIGRLANWADRLLSFVNSGQPALAIKLAMHFYENDGDLSVFGLPRNDSARKSAIKQALPDLILTAIQFSAQYDEENLKSLLPEALRAAALTRLNILEPILEIVDNEQWSRGLYLDTLLTLIKEHKLTTVSPVVFKELATVYADPQLFYNLSLSTLDLDLAFRLCAKYPEKLTEAKTFLENMALHDFISPLKDCKHAFHYLAFILTSRIYPTGKEMPEDRAREAKLQVYEALFLSDETYSLLHEYLSVDAAAFYTALNEAFEDPWLNDNTEISRQTIVNLLINIDSEKQLSSETAGKYTGKYLDIHLSVFIARNYPKYRQYLVLPETVLHEVVNQLCTPRTSELNSEEAQLALLSLLSIYKPWDTNEFVNKLVASRYTLVLHHVFRKRNQLVELLELMLRISDSEDFWPTLNECLFKNRSKSVFFITAHFKRLVELNAEELSKLVVAHNVTEIWSASAFGSMGDELKRIFLDCMFDEIEREGGKLPPAEICTLYVELLANNDCLTSNSNTRSSSDSNQSCGRLMYVLDHILTGPHDVELPMVVDTLIANERVDALAILLCRRDRKSEAMIYLLNFIPELSTSSSMSVDEREIQIDSCLKLACQICLDVSKESKEEGNRLCERLVETLVECDLTRKLKDVVMAMIDSSSVDISHVAAYLLKQASSISVPENTIQDEKSKRIQQTKDTVPKIIGKIYSELVQKERGLRCFFDIVLKDGHIELSKVLAGRAEGWAVAVDGECEICGRKIVGLGVNAEKLYADWWSQMLTEPAEKGLDGETLILFQCEHSYHNGCLKRMTSARHCIVCEQAVNDPPAAEEL